MTVRRSVRLVVVPFLVDAALVVAFAAAGRASHAEDVWAGLLATAGPFLVALILGWAAVRGWRAPTAVRRTGIPLWAITVVGGLLLRIAWGQGAAAAFVVVTALTLGAMLVGWRAAWTGARRLRRIRSVPNENMNS